MTSIFQAGTPIEKELIESSKRSILLQVDGGVKLDNLREVVGAGVDSVVSGSGVFGADDVEERTREFVKKLKEYETK